MTLRTTNIILLNKLMASLGDRPEAKLEIGADISRSSIRDMMRGGVPGQEVRRKVSSFFEISEMELWPEIVSEAA